MLHGLVRRLSTSPIPRWRVCWFLLVIASKIKQFDIISWTLLLCAIPKNNILQHICSWQYWVSNLRSSESQKYYCWVITLDFSRYWSLWYLFISSILSRINSYFFEREGFAMKINQSYQHPVEQVNTKFVELCFESISCMAWQHYRIILMSKVLRRFVNLNSFVPGWNASQIYHRFFYFKKNIFFKIISTNFYSMLSLK